MSWLPKQKVVVPIDFSDDTQRSIEVALGMVDQPANLHVVHVLVPLDHVSPGVLLGSVTDQKREDAIRKSIDDVIAKINVNGITTDVLIGDPGLEIAEYAERIGAELIVIPSHGYHGVKRIALGSVAERIIRHANCSVLVLRRGDAD